MTLQSKSVFIVSRDESWVRSSREIISAIGYSIQVFGSLQEYMMAAKMHSGIACACIDFGMDQMNCATMNNEFIQAGIAFPVLMVASESDMDLVAQEIGGMQFGSIAKTIPPTRFRVAMDEAFGRQKLVEHQVAVQRNHARLENLTERERAIVDLVVDGAPNKKIATHLGLSIKTIERVRQSAYRKLDVRSTAEMTKVVILGDLHDIVCENSAPMIASVPMQAPINMGSLPPVSPVNAPLIPPPMGLSRGVVPGQSMHSP